MFELEGVTVSFSKDVVALQPTNLVFRQGELTILLGPSGAGKSTLLRCLNGLVRPTQGIVRVGGWGTLGREGLALRRLRRDVGMVFQQHQLVAHRTAIANVLTGRLGHHHAWRTLLPLPRSDWHIALEALQRVGLLDRALDRVDTLSGGQQQRVAIARALAQRPRALLADEPVASLDPATAEDVLGMLAGICRQDGLTGVLSLHQVDLARRFADRVVGLSAGTVVFDGAPDALGAVEEQRIYRSPPHGRLPRRDDSSGAAPLAAPSAAPNPAT